MVLVVIVVAVVDVCGVSCDCVAVVDVCGVSCDCDGCSGCMWC